MNPVIIANKMYPVFRILFLESVNYANAHAKHHALELPYESI